VTLKVGVVGAGGIAVESHLPVLQNLKNVEVVAICDARAMDVVRRDETGLTVKPCDPGALAEAIEFLLRNPRRAEEMGLRGKVRFEEFFTEDKVVPKIIETYQEAVQNAQSNS